ncbi:MAG TPA: Hint domain-containing protein, partial [Paenirhodobacter sp.]
DLVTTADHGPQPVRWIGCSQMTAKVLAKNEKLRPIRIRAGALGRGLPEHDLIVSPEHRILVRSKIAERLFGAQEVLIAARQLLQIDGVDVAEDLISVAYYHVLFDRHEVVISNGAETESLFTGPQALKSVGRAAVEEIFAIFPDLRSRDYTPTAARILVSGRQGRKMIMRHIQHKRGLVAVA